MNVTYNDFGEKLEDKELTAQHATKSEDDIEATTTLRAALPPNRDFYLHNEDTPRRRHDDDDDRRRRRPEHENLGEKLLPNDLFKVEVLHTT